MENKQKQGYLYALIIGLLTVLVCMVIADGFVGIAGTIHDYKEFADGTHEFMLKVSDPTGRIIFWGGLLAIPMLFSLNTKVRYTWVNLPLYFVAWYSCFLIFGESVKHRYLAHPAQGFISFGNEFNSITTTLLFWIVQALVLLAARSLWLIIKKLSEDKEGNK
ncbi:MAG: hypothetical protein J6K15_09365 [Lachnospiraceae bacterium]|nr:hypothetical protein [Lachnospiraceae bacterium]MBO5176740.1 hypothetical protein [Lachnospiraceae bacterium]MBP3578304.1 hypothetical protein [Lachnospiraceae bacterium]